MADTGVDSTFNSNSECLFAKKKLMNQTHSEETNSKGT